MTRRNSGIAALAVMLGAAVVPVALAQEPTHREFRDTVTLRPTTSANVRAVANIRDDPKARTLAVTGRATGLMADRPYLSWFYDAGSVSTGSTACIPSVPAPPDSGYANQPTPALPVPAQSLRWAEMHVGTWEPMGATTRTLSIRKVGAAYVALRRVGTVSIRRIDAFGPQAQLPLQSCGATSANKPLLAAGPTIPSLAPPAGLPPAIRNLPANPGLPSAAPSDATPWPALPGVRTPAPPVLPIPVPPLPVPLPAL